jgi:DNA-directed RNA polymerase subunit M/transcription elongation factor TFIIS
VTFQSFTRNYIDHSNEQGFQFEFHCDKCRNGYRSSFQVNKASMVTSLIKSASGLLGGVLNNASWGADQVKDMLRGPAWDAAFKEAVEEIRPLLHQCTRCGSWVCPQVCWNEERALCETCAPNLQEEAAQIQARVAVDQLQKQARETDQTQGQDIATPQMAACPHCNSHIAPGTKFCSACGQALRVDTQAQCRKCGSKLAGNAKFCGNCGTAA